MRRTLFILLLGGLLLFAGVATAGHWLPIGGVFMKMKSQTPVASGDNMTFGADKLTFGALYLTF